MAFIDMSTFWSYKDLLTYQDMNQLGENDTFMIRTDIGDQTINGATGTGEFALTINQNVSNGGGLKVECLVNEAGSHSVLNVTSNLASRTAVIVNIVQDSGSSSADVLKLQNDGSGKSILLTPAVTRYLAVSPTEFNYANNISFDLDGIAVYNTGTGATLMTTLAPVNLPHNSVVTSFKAYWYRDDGTSSGVIQLQRANFIGAGTAMVNADANVTTGYHSVNGTSITNGTINNNSFTYSAVLQLTNNNGTGDVYFTGAVISYTVNELP